MDKRFVLCYTLDNDKVINFEFNPDVDYRKYNKTILQLYGKRIKNRYVYDKVNKNQLSLKQLDVLIDKLE